MGGGEWEVKRCMWFLCLVEHFQAMRPVFCCGLIIRYARGYFYSFRFWICMNIWKGHNWTMIRNLGTHNKPEDSSGVPGEHRRSTGAPWVPSAWQSLSRRIGKRWHGCLVNLRRRSGWHRSWRRGSSSGRAGWGWAASTPPTSCLRERGPSGFLGLPTSRYQFQPGAPYVMMCRRSFPPNFCRFSPSSQALVYYMINETRWYLFVACFSVSLSHDHMAECAHVSWCPCI